MQISNFASDFEPPPPVSGGSAPPSKVTLELDDLLHLEASALETLYREATMPALESVSGDLRGRMLAVVGNAKLPLLPVSALAPAEWFPWRGKSFYPQSASDGSGINRVFSDRLKLFRFATRIGPSKAGPFDALQLDYDSPDNPWFIRCIEDEIRELKPGLWLGQAYLRTARAAHLVLYFGLSR